MVDIESGWSKLSPTTREALIADPDQVLTGDMLDELLAVGLCDVAAAGFTAVDPIDEFRIDGELADHVRLLRALRALKEAQCELDAWTREHFRTGNPADGVEYGDASDEALVEFAHLRDRVEARRREVESARARSVGDTGPEG